MIDRSSASSAEITIPGNPALEGIWLGNAGGAAVVAPPHPLMGGHLSNPVVEALAAGVVAAGHRALLFNFRGVGESFGEPSADPDAADDDFRAAIAVAARFDPIIAAGYSFGAAAALRAASHDARIRAVVAVAPPPALVGEVSLERLEGRVTIIGAERDHFARPDELRTFALGATRGRFEVVEGADHFFSRGLDRVTSIAEDALRTVR